MKAAFPGVSVIITSYNYDRFIARTIASARAQDVPDFEIVVVDNASTDTSWEIISAAAAEDPRIRAFRNPENIGMNGNHQRGLELATKPKVLFLSADDYFLPGHLSRLIAAHLEHPEIDYFFTAYVHVDDEDRLIRYVRHVGHPRGSYFGGRNEFADLLTYDCYACMPTTLFDRDELLRSGFDPQIIAGDYDHYLRLAAAGARFAFLDTAGVALRIHAEEFGGRERYMATGKQLLDQIAILEKHLTPANAELIAGREQGIATLLVAKVNNLSQFPEAAAAVMPSAQPRIDNIVGFLNESRQRYLAKPLPAAPKVSVILVLDDDLQSALATIETLEAQEYVNWELVIVANGTLHVEPLVRDRAGRREVRFLHHAAPQTRGVSLNDGLALAGGEIICYADPGVLWPADHLERVAGHFHDRAVEALVFSGDYVAYRADTAGAPATVDVAHLEGFAGSRRAEQTVHVGEAVPLSVFCHRRGILDRFGRFDEQLNHLTDFEFVSRVFDKINTGLDERHAVLLRRRVDLPTRAMRDPSGYLNELQIVYARGTVAPEIAQRRQRHLTLVHGELSAVARGESRDPLRFDTLLAGVEQTP
jgi:glycosyltransferase involved in cell wall biosynthesis